MRTIRNLRKEALAAYKFPQRLSLDQRVRRQASVFCLAEQLCPRALRALGAKMELLLGKLDLTALNNG